MKRVMRQDRAHRRGGAHGTERGFATDLCEALEKQNSSRIDAEWREAH